MNFAIQRLEEKHLAAAVALSSDAGWNQNVNDWMLLLRLAPRTCFGIDCDGQLAATTTLVRYGDRLAWLGMVLTHRQYQRRGFARRLLEHCLNKADELGVQTIKLDATDQGWPIYEKMGFRMEQTIQRWAGCLMPGATEALGCAERSLAKLTEFDRDVFGADRTLLLTLLSEHANAFQTSRGYLCYRPGFRASYLGPCIANSDAEAEQLIRHALKRGGNWFWDILEENQPARALAAAFGFSVQRTLRRMLRGKEHRQQTDKIYAIAGFELG